VYGLIPIFYDEPRKGNPDDIRRGDVYLDQPVYLPGKWGLRLTRIDPTDSTGPEFEFTGRTADIFNHIPLKRPRLDSHEAFVAHTAKWERPVIVLSAANAYEPVVGAGGERPTDSYLCAPVYGSDQFPKELRDRIAAYEFPNLFYLPSCTRPPFDEGFVRLDHMQAISRGSLRSRRCNLTEDALNALDEWVVHYLTGTLPPGSLIEAYRTEELQRLNSATGDADRP
jgi:hypothetical protein